MTPERFRQIEELYHAARAKTGPERAALLAETDPAVRSAVESLLQQPERGEFLDRPALENAAEESGWNRGDAAATVLMAETQFGPYRIERKLEEGGMGEVFRAVDTRLGRAVAIKTAHERFSARFEREARAISSLNHPNICTLYDVGPNYLVMELVEGETLAAQLKHGPLPQKTALLYASQILAALVEAHSKGVIHRDIKPGNIMIAKSGIKVLDFGLAKSGGDETVTASHMVMGTPAYMAPEQREGGPADARSDIYSFGCVLHEMLTGARPTERRRIRPRKLENVVRRCLEPDPERRWQSVAELERAFSTKGLSSRWKRAAPVAAAAVGMAAIAGWYFGTRKPAVTSPSEYVQITDFSNSASAPALSPDGHMLAFLRGSNPFLSTEQVYVKALPDGQSRQVTNDPLEKYNPVFTPDGSRIAYTALNRKQNSWDTWTVPVTGGSSSILMRNAAGLRWIGNGRLLFSELESGTPLHMGIVTSLENRAEERRIYFPQGERAMAHYSYLSPDQKSILTVEMDPAWLPCRLLSMEKASNGRQAGPPGACTAAAWSPDGKWMYFSEEVNGAGHLWRQRFPDGVPEQITMGPGEQQGLAMAPDGKSLITSVGVRKSSVWLHDAAGERPLSPEGSAASPEFSPDGKRVYYLLRKNSSSANELWWTDRSSMTSHAALSGVSLIDFDISHDGEKVAFTARDDSGPGIFIAPLDGSARPRLVVRGGDTVSFGGGGELFFLQLGTQVKYLSRVRTDGTGVERILDYPVSDSYYVSPDARWVVLAGVGAAGGTVAVSLKDGTRKPICAQLCTTRWSADGKYLFVTLNPIPAQSAPTLVFPVPLGASVPTFQGQGLSPYAYLESQGVPNIRENWAVPGPDPQTYAFLLSEFVGNLFRIPLH